MDKSLVGVAGEYALASHLSRLGYIVTLTLKNARGIDVFASKGGETVTIQVKTRSPGQRQWRMPLESRWPAVKYFVLVDLGPQDQFWVVPSAELKSQVETDARLWIETPGRGGRQRQPNTARFLGGIARDQEFLTRYCVCAEHTWDALLGIPPRPI